MTNQYPYRYNTTQGTASQDDPRYETPGGAANKIEQALEDAKEYTDAELLTYEAQTVNLADDAVTRPKIAPGAVGASEIDPSLLDYTTDIAVAAKFNEVDAQLADTVSRIIVDKSNSTLYFGHRGASNIAPENTLPAFEQCGRLGFYGIETDAIMSADGVWMCMHDLTIDRTTTGTGYVKDLTLAQLKAVTIDAGSNVGLYPNLRIPTVEEYLGVCKTYGLMPLIEIKADIDFDQGDNLPSLIDLVRRMGMEDRCSFIADTAKNANDLRALSKKIIIHYLCAGASHEIALAQSLGNAAIDVLHSSLTQSIVDTAHDLGLAVNTWGLSNLTQLQNMRALGVDFITSDNYGGF